MSTGVSHIAVGPDDESCPPAGRVRAGELRLCVADHWQHGGGDVGAGRGDQIHVQVTAGDCRRSNGGPFEVFDVSGPRGVVRVQQQGVPGPEQREQPQGSGDRGAGEAGGIGCAPARVGRHDGAVGVVDQQLRFATDDVVGIGGIGADALTSTAHRPADDLFADGATFGVVAVEQVGR